MKSIYFFLLANIIAANIAFSQCKPYIIIDGNMVIADQTVYTGLILPLWLKETQTIATDQGVNSVSVIEFNVTGGALEFSQVLSIATTSPQTVPDDKVWKIESIVKKPAFGNFNSVTYSVAGSNTFTVPSCADYICIEAWGGGGGGGCGCSSTASGGGGGGGSYGQGCFSVTSGSSISVTVGGGGSGSTSGGVPGGNGGNTIVGTLVTANGGNGGITGSPYTGGNGGTCTAPVNVTGGKGGDGCATQWCGGIGGYGGNGGAGGGGGSASYGGNGVVPGGGGGGGAGTNGGGNGAAGKVIISW